MEKTVLIVDDEEDIRDALADYIESLNHFKTFRASNGTEALEVLNKNKADLVISDIRMPQGDGIFLIKNLKDKIDGGMKFVFMTGYSDLSRNEALTLGAKEIFYKPFSLVMLGNQIRELLGEKPQT